tara:strand:+ start:660 stop:974 length:315 start_codon:yes stop_codon:yes gene_type:complete
MGNEIQKNKKTADEKFPQIEKLMEMPVTARLVLGECEMEIEEILRLGQGSIIELDTMVEETLKLYINNEEIAKASSVKVGEKIGMQIKQISSTEKRLKDLTDLE